MIGATKKTVECDLPNGRYPVAASVRWTGRVDGRNQIAIEGMPFVTNAISDPYLAHINVVTIVDNSSDR